MLADAVEVERDLLRSLSPLAEAGVAPPVLGEEVEVDDEFMVLDLSWPAERVAVFAEPPAAGTRADLEGAGWRVVDADADMLLKALREGTAG